MHTEKNAGGRPPKAPGEKAVACPLSLYPHERKLLKELGGSRWVRAQLEREMRRRGIHPAKA